MHKFTKKELERYSRNILLDCVGEKGQGQIIEGKVLVVGAGGLGSPILLYLAASGVGTLGVMDDDDVDVSNLQRQVIHNTEKVGTNKAESAKETIQKLNPLVNVKEYKCRLTEENAEEIMKGYDFVVEATDSIGTKYLVSDVCDKIGKACCIGGITRYSGQVTTYVKGTKTYRDIFPEPPVEECEMKCSIGGVLGVIPGLIGMIQATEVLKYLTNVGELLTDKILTYDAKTMDFRKFEV